MFSLRVLRKDKRFLWWIPVILWMGMIFTASSDSLSGERSSRILGPVLNWLFPGMAEGRIDAMMLGIRKCAHLVEYAVLALLVLFAMRGTRPNEPHVWKRRDALVAMAFVVAYAITDELHQSVVPTRIGTPVDVMIDTVGGAAGLFVTWLAGKLLKRW